VNEDQLCYVHIKFSLGTHFEGSFCPWKGEDEFIHIFIYSLVNKNDVECIYNEYGVKPCHKP